MLTASMNSCVGAPITQGYGIIADISTPTESILYQRYAKTAKAKDSYSPEIEQLRNQVFIRSGVGLGMVIRKESR
jgi:hypothetical protein